MAAYSGNWNGAPSSTGGSRGGGNSASPYMRNGMFTARGEGPFTSIAVQTGKYSGIPSGFSSASPFMQGGIFRAQGEGPFRSPGIQPPGLQNRGYTGTTGPAGGGGRSVISRPLPPPAVAPQVVPTSLPRESITQRMVPGLFKPQGSIAPQYPHTFGPRYPTFETGLNQWGPPRYNNGYYGYTSAGNSVYNDPRYGFSGISGSLANYGGSPTSGLKGDFQR